MNYRLEQIKSKLSSTLAPIISAISSKYILTIAEIELSADLRYADIYLSVFRSNNSFKKEIDKQDFDQIKELIHHEYSYINSLFISKYQSKRSPVLRFHIDKRQLHIANIDRLLKADKSI
jgi:ribosome-binding factor A